jgi:TRAP-type C4-dicarboxylate transport system permease large subunit
MSGPEVGVYGIAIMFAVLFLLRIPADLGGIRLLLWVILPCYIIGGCIMDALAFLLVSLPIFYPIVMEMGYDPIWFGQVMT